jgi:adenylate cyclase
MTARILVVDDEPDVEALILQRFRYKIRDEAVSFLFARDGVEALATLKADRNIDLVVTDINMPGMDGLYVSTITRLGLARGQELCRVRWTRNEARGCLAAAVRP